MSPQRKRLITEISFIAKKMATIVRDADMQLMIPHSEWTIGDMTAHVIFTQNIVNSHVSDKQSVYIKNKNKFIEEASHNISREYIANVNRNFLLKLKPSANSKFCFA